MINLMNKNENMSEMFLSEFENIQDSFTKIVIGIPVMYQTVRNESTCLKLLNLLLGWMTGPQFKLRLYSQV